MELKLTPRQQTFLDKLFELYRENGGSVHYSVVAERLGVNRFSAYDMLKVLEEKELAASEYVLDQESSGPGRSQVVFYPTSKAARFLSQLRDERRTGDEWQLARERILRKLKENLDTNRADTLETLKEIVGRLPNVKSPQTYCAEVISALLLYLNETWHSSGLASVPALNSPWLALKALGTNGEVGLGTLAGLGLGSIFSGSKVDPSLADNLVSLTKRFQSDICELSEEKITMLSGFLQDALAVFDKSANVLGRKSSE